MEVDIQARHTEVVPRWQQIIERGIAKLQHQTTRITHVRVTLTQSTHHLIGDDEVQLVLTLPHTAVTVHKRAAQMADALRAAFTAAEKQLRTHRDAVKTHIPPAADQHRHGTVHKLIPGEGYGFLLSDGDEVFFTAQAVRKKAFDKLSVGQSVTFIPEHGEKGLQATVVFPATRRAKS